ncbi:MAG: hypothetical protein L0271_00970 [Gemmatimonadetes bacterium]|nr:hypothetical protein [Gemmatimonadota bacterium]
MAAADHGPLMRTTTLLRFPIIAMLVIAAVGAPTAARAQEVRAMSLEQVERLLAAGVPANQILDAAREACLGFDPDAATEQRLANAGANPELLSGLRSICRRPVSPLRVEVEPATQPGSSDHAVPRRYDAGGALVRSLVVPGLGQLYTGHTARGVLFLSAWGSALGIGLLRREVTVECLDRVTTSCPPDRVRGTVTRRKLLPIAAAGALAVALISAIDARAAAAHANRNADAAAGLQAGSEPGLETMLDLRPDGAAVLSFRMRW